MWGSRAVAFSRERMHADRQKSVRRLFRGLLDRMFNELIEAPDDAAGRVTSSVMQGLLHVRRLMNY